MAVIELNRVGPESAAVPLRGIREALGASGRCLGGGEERAGAGTQPHYAYYGETDADFQAAHTSPDMDPAVVAVVTKMRTRDPCGDLTSIVPALTAASRRAEHNAPSPGGDVAPHGLPARRSADPAVEHGL